MRANGKRPAGRQVESMHPLIQDNLEAIRALARVCGLARLEVFGSV